MLKRIKHWLYSRGYWKPTKVHDKIDIILAGDIHIYRLHSSVPFTTSDIDDSMVRLEYVNSVDYETQYAMSIALPIRLPIDAYLHSWYSRDGEMLDDSVIRLWLVELRSVVIAYQRPTVAGSVAARNNGKLRPFINECIQVVEILLIR